MKMKKGQFNPRDLIIAAGCIIAVVVVYIVIKAIMAQIGK